MPVVIGEKDAAATGAIEIVKKRGLWTESRRFEKSFYVLADLNDDEDAVRNTTGVPPIASPYQGAVCRGHKPEERGRVRNPLTGQPGILWEVVCSFDNDITPDDAEDAGGGSAPTSRRPKIRWRGVLEDEVLERDAIDGIPITTTAGEKVLVTHPVPYPILEVRRFENRPYEPLNILNYVSHTNENPFYGAPTGSALMLPIEADEVEVDGEPYVEAVYQIQFKLIRDPDNPSQFLPDGWKYRYLNNGHIYIDTVTGKYVRAVDEEGNPIKVNLDEGGYRISEDAEPTYSERNRFPKADFDNLNLGPF